MNLPEDMTVKARVLQTTEEAIGWWHARGRVDSSGKQTVRLHATVHWIEYFGLLHVKWSVDNDDRSFPVVPPKETVGFDKVYNISDAGRLAVHWLDQIRQKVVLGHKELRDADAFELDPDWAARVPPRQG